jgi:hypothetical protein
MEITATDKRKYVGDAAQAPRWVKKMVAPWYRRALTNPLSLYFVIVTGITVCISLDGWQAFLAGVPTFILLAEVTAGASERWYEQRYQKVAVTKTPAV